MDNMKRWVSVILFFFSMCCYAGDSIRYYETTSFSYKRIVNGEWTDWSEWKDSGMIITLNMTKDVIEIMKSEAKRDNDYNKNVQCIYYCVKGESLEDSEIKAIEEIRKNKEFIQLIVV